ncbi:MAG: hypothetical protein ABSF10_08840 [Verrucomicrobiota bacterium]
MKTTKFFLLIAVAALLGLPANAQSKMVQGKIYSVDDPAWAIFNCNMEVAQTSGNDLICKTFQTVSSSHTVIGHNVNGRTAAVVNDSHRVYGKTIALRNYSNLPVGYIIDYPIKAIHVGKISVISTGRTGGMIDETAKASRSYELYDMGTDYFPPKRPLTPEEKKAQAQKIAEAKIKALESDKGQASNGVSAAQCRLGLAYLNGQGVETNRSLAIEWLGKSATQGNVEAQEALKKISENSSTNSP